ncbi:hypothetical protein [Escherichia coli]|uniref:hypothetical protein n=1 Tax=Escherichia coli TaxID=562 RepID=UPI003F763FCF
MPKLAIMLLGLIHLPGIECQHLRGEHQQCGMLKVIFSLSTLGGECITLRLPTKWLLNICHVPFASLSYNFGLSEKKIKTLPI